MNSGKKCDIVFCNNPFRSIQDLKRSCTMFFKSDYRDLMPAGSDANEAYPGKKSFRLFFTILALNCGAVLKANLLFLLFCIPVVTIPIGLLAINRVMHRIMIDLPVKCLQIYGETFRQMWKQSYLTFLLTVFPLVFAGYGMWFYLKRIVSTPLFFLPFLVCSTIFLVVLLSSGCLYGLLAAGNNLKEALRLALLLGITKPLRTVPAALCCYGLPLLAVLAFPFSGMYLLLIGFSLPCMIGSFLLRVVLRPFIAIK